MLPFVLSLVLSLVLADDAVSGLGTCTGDQEDVKPCFLAECVAEVCVDCEWNVWSGWGECECNGLQQRYRTMKRTNTPCGKPCVGNRVETQQCQPSCVHTQRDCIFGNWEEWSACDKTCGGGERSRKRDITQHEANGGNPCSGDLVDVDVCGEVSCLKPANCVFSDWSGWNACSKTCGKGQQERQRSVQSQAKDDGVGCTGDLSEYRDCTSSPCAGMIDCLWSQWVEWSACSATCGSGDRSRSRLIKVAPRNGGKLCEPLPMSEVAACQVEPCATTDCAFSGWTEWDACSCSCNGIRTRTRHISQFPESGLPCSGSLKEIEPCNQGGCGLEVPVPAQPEDCVAASWGVWGVCSKTCGGGLRFRERQIDQAPDHGGMACDLSLREVEGCAREECIISTPDTTEGDIDCLWSAWDDWGACSVTCGGGQKIRQRQISQMANGGGAPCQQQSAMQVAACNSQRCECQDCTWTAWSDWAACTCTGIQERHRSVQTHFNHCGKPCVGSKVDTQSCDPHCEKKSGDCVWSAWTEWGACTDTCGGGQQERTRKHAVSAKNGGSACQGAAREIQACGGGLCEDPVDCVMGVWGAWSRCSSSCGAGERYRSRDIVTHPEAGGTSCKGGLREVDVCYTEGDCCARTDCKWGDWSSYSACSASCGEGYKTRDRQIVQGPECGGALCEALSKSESVPCFLEKCNADGCVDGKWGAWDEWTTCSAECGGGFSARVRCIDVQGNYCGKGVDGKMTEYRTCGSDACVDTELDCEFADWGAWSDCSCSCDGVQDRTRQIAVFAQKGGRPCSGPIKQFTPCNVGTCTGTIQDCQLSEWNKWEGCTAKCGGGHQVRNRVVLKVAKHGGEECEGFVREMHPCNMQPCGEAVDCLWGGWSDWSACSRQCDGGEQFRYRHVETMPKDGGRECQQADSVEMLACNVQVCGKVQYCGWGVWTQWSHCSVTCGHGQSVRQRTLRVTTSEPEEVISSGVLDQLHSQLGELQGKFSFEHLVIVYVFGALSMTLLVSSAYYVYMRLPTRAADSDPSMALELQLLREEDE